jgi:hypothetical protein
VLPGPCHFDASVLTSAFPPASARCPPADASASTNPCWGRPAPQDCASSRQRPLATIRGTRRAPSPTWSRAVGTIAYFDFCAEGSHPGIYHLPLQCGTGQFHPSGSAQPVRNLVITPAASAQMSRSIRARPRPRARARARRRARSAQRHIFDSIATTRSSIALAVLSSVSLLVSSSRTTSTTAEHSMAEPRAIA